MKFFIDAVGHRTHSLNLRETLSHAMIPIRLYLVQQMALRVPVKRNLLAIVNLSTRMPLEG